MAMWLKKHLDNQLKDMKSEEISIRWWTKMKSNSIICTTKYQPNIQLMIFFNDLTNIFYYFFFQILKIERKI